jgi:hypothetical protein
VRNVSEREKEEKEEKEEEEEGEEEKKGRNIFSLRIYTNLSLMLPEPQITTRSSTIIVLL